MDDGISARGDRRIEMKPVEGRVSSGHLAGTAPDLYARDRQAMRAQAIEEAHKLLSVAWEHERDSLRTELHAALDALSIERTNVINLSKALSDKVHEFNSIKANDDVLRKANEKYAADNARLTAAMERNSAASEEYCAWGHKLRAERDALCEQRDELRKANDKCAKDLDDARKLYAGARTDWNDACERATSWQARAEKAEAELSMLRPSFDALVAAEVAASAKENRWPWGSDHLAKVSVRQRLSLGLATIATHPLEPLTIPALLEAFRLFTGETADVINDRGTWEAKLGEGPRAVEHRAESAERAVFGLLVITKL